MVLTRTDENELLTALYAGQFQELPWRLFLTRLRARTESDMCRLLVRPTGEGAWRPADSVEGRAAAAESFPFDPAAFDDLRSGRVYAEDELGAKTAGYGRHIRVAWPDGGDLLLSILRAKGSFRARDSSLVASLAPHLTIALRARMELEGERRRAAIAGQALSSFSEGWMLLDARGRVLDADRGAARLLDGVIVRRGAEGRVRFLYAEAETLLEEVLACRTMPDEPRSAWLAIDPPIQMLAMRPPPGGDGTLPAAHCLILMRRMTVNRPADGRFLPQLFRLTRSEAALAERIAGGESLTEAAEALGLTIETARNYSKRIFVKTGARGQVDLVRIVLEGVRVLREG
ncbi:hypothetical protein LWE61_17970 [Sphingobium sufflavum]|uniref:helix-turn-helix transcriptional regulator n=1 Tax=Sphingobium sufflavum TaxID=1129547 RepID=UPI001F2C1159|nr:hypothetical protein [Sphingobium sufflavum]MCE7798429.1 hypothetical protein [Sphingobium sufflavum]